MCRMTKQVLACGALMGASLSYQQASTSAVATTPVLAAAAQSVSNYKPASVNERVRALLTQVTEEKIEQLTKLANATISHTGQQKGVTFDSAKLLPLLWQFHVGSLVYPNPRTSWNRTAAGIYDQRTEEFFYPSFQAAIDSEVKNIMVSGGQINGEPVHASRSVRVTNTGICAGKETTFWILTDELGRTTRPHNDCRRQLENGYFALHIGEQLKRFRYKGATA